MNKRKLGKKKDEIVKYQSNSISQERIIEIQAEAYYRALKRIENEKLKEAEKMPEKNKYKWYEEVFFLLNTLFWPWKISKKFSVSNRIYDSILVLIISSTFVIVGTVIWIIGIIGQVYLIYRMIKLGITGELLIISAIMLYVLLGGSILVLAGNEFEKEKDSNKIYAYSASIIALISCIVSIIALLKN